MNKKKDEYDRVQINIPSMKTDSTDWTPKA